jgi:exopolysaccharide biosynthesis polyprenyl glycosylphosphotransferase
MSVSQEACQPLELPAIHPFGNHRRGWLIRRALLSADLIGLLVAFALAQSLYGTAGGTAAATLGRIGSHAEYLTFIASLPLWVLLAKAYRLYANDEERTDHSTIDEVIGIFHLVTVGTFAVLALSWVTGLASPQFAKIFVFWLCAIAFVSVGRAGARTVCRRRASYLQNAVIVGCGHVGQTVAKKFLKHPEYGVNIVGFIDAEPRDRASVVNHLPVLGTVTQLRQIVSALRVDRVIIAFSSDSHEQLLGLMRTTKDLPVQVDVVPRLFEMITPTVQLHQVEGLPLMSMPPMRLSRSDRAVKRGIDVLIGIVALVALAPIFAGIAIAIKLTSRGPVFFRQERVGERDCAFRMWKFRSMVVDAESRRGEVSHLNRYLADGDDPVMFKVPNDPRTTRVGRVLRITSLDELPQLINVVVGDMSIVGPRPLIPAEDSRVDDWGRRRLELRPGMTGLWQVLGRNDIPFAEMVGLDYQYVTTWSAHRDLALMLRTATAVFRSARAGIEGGRRPGARPRSRV